MVDSNLTFLTTPSSPYYETNNLKSISTPFYVQHFGPSQSKTSNVKEKASDVYSSAGTEKTIYFGGDYYGAAGIYTTELFDVTKDTVFLSARFFCRSSDNGGAYNEHWFGLAPENCTYFHPVLVEGSSASLPVGYLIGGWPTFWSARDRGTTSSTDFYYIPNFTKTMKMSFGEWFEISLTMVAQNDTLKILNYTAVNDAGKQDVFNNPTSLGTVSNNAWFKKMRLGVFVDDMVSWIKISKKPIDQVQISKKNIKPFCEGFGAIKLFDSLKIDGLNADNNNCIIKLMRTTNSSLSSSLNKTLVNGILPASYPWGKHLFLIQSQNTFDSFEIIINATPILKISKGQISSCAGDNPNKFDVSSVNTDLSKSTIKWGSSIGISNDYSKVTFYSKYKSKGIDTVTLSVTSEYGCLSSIKEIINVFDTIQFGITGKNHCFGDDFDSKILFYSSDSLFNSISWDLGNSVKLLNTKSINYNYLQDGIYNVICRLTSKDGCVSSSNTQTIIVYPMPSLSIKKNQSAYCISNSNYQFEGLSNNTDLTKSNIKWSTIFGESIDFNLVSFNNKYKFKGVDTIGLDVTSEFGCSASIYEVINVFDTIKFSIIGESHCFGSGFLPMMVFDGIDSLYTSNEWDMGDNAQIVNTKYLNYTYVKDGQYIVKCKLTSLDGCISSSNTLEINVYKKPQPQFNYQIEKDVSGSILVLNSTFEPKSKYTYKIFDTLINPQSKTLKLFSNQSGEFPIKLIQIDSNNCMDSIQGLVKLEIPILNEMYTPNAFTPNGDGLNDNFRPNLNSTSLKKVRFRVYNRWGEKLFDADNVDIGWDGKYMNELVVSGTYIYLIDYIDLDNFRNQEKGIFQLFH
jgi:gliding motility-associated-like protein